ncbi:MAG: hypothetical protein M1834_005521 [Cirrosporium novae-zelandiae]|nr:MAG: hypothetical protein M1834_005521 [Cirrosporium novae-zelandiae]
MKSDNILQTALLNVFTDIVEFSVKAVQYFGRGTLAGMQVRLSRLILHPTKEEFRDITERIVRHAKIVDHVAVATELIKADKSRKETRLRQEQNLQLQCEGWLRPSNARVIQQDQAQKRLSGTCEWIWTNRMFMDWYTAPSLSASDKLMCICGTHGCGKSVLASFIIDRLWKNQLHALFFAFSGTNANQQNLDGLIRSLLWQLLQTTASEKSVGILHSLMLRGRPLTSELWEVFNKMAVFVTEPVYCVVDGVDECKDAIQELIRNIFNFLNAHSNFRFILLGRPHAFQAVDSIRHTLEICPALTEGDIDTVIETRIVKSKILSLPKLRDTIFKTLREQSDGNFLWIKLMLGQLNRSLTLAEVSMRLHNLPHDLEAAYEDFILELVERLDPSELDLARKVLAFITVSQRPLSLNEFQHLHAADAMSICPHENDSFQDHLLLEPRRILDVCGDLINITDGRLRLVHFSVKEFLVRPETQWLQGNSRKIMRFRVPLEDTHRSFGAACAEYLKTSDYGSLLNDSDTSPRLEKYYPFLDYSSRYMITHLNQSGPPSAPILEKIDRFLSSDRFISWLELFVMNIVEDESLHSQADEFQMFGDWLDNDWRPEKLSVSKVSARLEGELTKRTQQYGQNDSRAEQLRLFLGILKDTNTLPNSRGSQAAGTCAAESLGGSTDISPILHILRNEVPLPLQLKVNLLLRLQYYLQKVQVLTDPLKILFRLILQKASVIPVYALLLIGDFYRKVNKFEQALDIYSAALTKMNTQETPTKFLVLHLTGRTYSDLSQHDEALEYFNKALTGRKKILEPEHRDILATIYWIGITHYKFGQLNKALEYLGKSLIGREKVLGPKHESTLSSVHWIGSIYFELGQYNKALEYFEKALAGEEKVLGPEHKDTLSSISWIGSTYYELGQFNKALEYFEKFLIGREEVLGSEYKSILWSVCRAGSTYYELGQYNKALEYFERALVEQEKVPGLEHEDILPLVYWTGITYYRLNQNNKALEYMKKFLAGYEKLFGQENEKTLWTVYQIGIVYDHLEQYDEALEYYQKALAGREKVLGPEHEDTLEVAADLRELQEKLSDMESSMELQGELSDMEPSMECQETLSDTESFGRLQETLSNAEPSG